MPSTPNAAPTRDPEAPTSDPEALTGDPESTPQVDAPVTTEASEPERRRISDYLGDVFRLETELATERRQNEALRAEVLYQRHRIEREEEARLQLMQLLDNSQRLLDNAQRYAQHLLGDNSAEIFTMALPEGSQPPAEDALAAKAAATPPRKQRWRWWGRR